MTREHGTKRCNWLRSILSDAICDRDHVPCHVGLLRNATNGIGKDAWIKLQGQCTLVKSCDWSELGQELTSEAQQRVPENRVRGLCELMCVSLYRSYVPYYGSSSEDSGKCLLPAKKRASVGGSSLPLDSHRASATRTRLPTIPRSSCVSAVIRQPHCTHFSCCTRNK